MLPSKKKTTITDLMDDPDYAAAWNKLQELQEQRLGLEAKRTSVRNATAARRDRLDDAANELLALGNLSYRFGDATGELQAIAEHLAIVDRAIEMQTEVVDRLAREVNNRICRDARPVYVAIVGKMKAALMQAAEVIAEEERFRDKFREGGLSFVAGLYPLGFPGGHLDLNEHSSTISYWLREAAEHYPEVK
ncbi:MAG TPA: hypothetical protein VG713_18090 [Pirellulales bacterium]|nr:hypothetical protein [Pirellulales bacterium]